MITTVKDNMYIIIVSKTQNINSEFLMVKVI